MRELGDLTVYGRTALSDWQCNPDWCFWDHPLIELSGKTMGMKVLVYDAYKIDSLVSDTCRYTELDELYALSDVIALHCPLFPDTEGIVNRNSIAKMKDGVIILNDSRGPLIVEEDLREALDRGKVAAAGLDVVSTEPIRGENPLLQAKNCIITPHIAWAPKESRQSLMDIAVSNLRAFVDGECGESIEYAGGMISDLLSEEFRKLGRKGLAADDARLIRNTGEKVI